MAKAKEVTTKFRVDLSEFKSGISQANQDIKLANAQFKNASAGMDNWGKSSEGLSAKIKQLNTVLEAEKSKLSNLEKEQQACRTEEQKASKAKEELKQKIDALQKEYDELVKTQGESSQGAQDLKKSITALNKEYLEAEKAQSRNAKEADKLEVQIQNQSATIKKTEKEINNYEGSLKDVSEAEKMAEKTGKSVDECLEEIGKEANKTENEMKDLKDQTKETGDGFTVFKGILANLGSAAIIGTLSGLKQLGGAFIDLGKQAVQSYAENEQLIGGVETLFKKSASTVQNYANNAYKTAGMSANQYMETVTSFSAGLLQSLDGDTAKAAKVADMAITDMSDNANKMGTDIGTIQTAYQGFAKQNYTMLDNLKLG